MTEILSDAAYSQLTPVEQTNYWRARFYQKDEECEQLHRKVLIRDQVLRTIRETLARLS